MNSQYRYENQYIWYNDAWKNKDGLVDPLMQWIGNNDTLTNAPEYPKPEGDPKKHPYYRAKTKCVDLPEVTAYWSEKGIRYTSLEQGRKYWISMLPEKAMQTPGAKLKALIVMLLENSADPWWAMNTLAKYQAYNELAARRQDTVIIYLTAMGADTDHIFGGIMQEACCLYPVDLEKVYLDVSLPKKLGVKLSQIEGFRWKDAQGSEADPDALVEDFEGIPVLNISGRWGTKDSLTRGLIMNQAMNRGMFDTEWLIHTKGGKKMTEGILLEYKFQTVNDPGYAEYWDAMGLKLDIKETQGRRWLMYAPKQQLETGEKLPLVLAMQEVYAGNEHLAVTAASYFYEYMELAAQGECMVLFFALEDPDSNDLLADIAREAMEDYPVDRSRVYVTGHSHDGWFARHFAFRHPDMIAALATMGNHIGLPDPAVVGNRIMGVSDEEIAQYAKFDMPTINVNGACERFSQYPETEEEQVRWAMDWQRRLKAHRCAAPSVEEILAVRSSENKAIRALGVSADQGQTCFFDGVEHYVADIQNTDGKYHLRIASSENMPHTVTPCMVNLAWSYIRRFARNLETGEVIDLYENK